ncbi:hypothetical protein EDB19DRAFT_1670362 [Suillus lakei]|nr:hypothetical protein EDB19DRAFT_1670362 [Suillus lakei]
MHPALTNLEVICTISSYTQRRSLPALASTCHAFKHPALNALWRDLQSVKPLVRCLPSHLFGGLRGVELREPLDDGMWDTLFKYTSRVHSITVPQSDVLEPLCLVMLSCPSAPASLFPNLRKLTWHAYGTRPAAEFLRMAFVPSLVELDIDISSPSSAFFSALSSLGKSCPHLQNMTVNVQNDFRTEDLMAEMSPFVTRPISQLHRLQILSVCGIRVQGMEHFVELRALQSLSLDLTTSSAWDTKSHLLFPGFHDLTLLNLSTGAVEQASNFLSSLQVVSSKEIKVDFIDGPYESIGSKSTAISQFFAVVQERCDNDKLEFVSLDGVYSEQAHIRRSVFAPLYACHNLTRLLITNVCDISMSDKELCQLATAWPKLQVLQIKCYTTDKTAVPTFHGLTSLLWRCPALTSLALVIDTTKLGGIDLKGPGGGRCNKHLEFLALGNSPIEVPVNVALIISGLFPNLKKVDLDCWDAYQTNSTAQQKSVRQQWKLVNSIIGGFSVVRERGIEA